MRAAICFSVAFPLTGSVFLGMDTQPPSHLLGTTRDYPSPRYVMTMQDHFDSANDQRWQQAYYVNDTFWVPGSDAPIFLCVGGEGPALQGDAVVDSVHCSNAAEWLPEKQALMFALEHRYYGCHNMSACPVTDFGDERAAFRFLSSRQAVEDVANFVRAMNSEYRLSAANKWVTWGGSYPGMMAAWSRLKHPELIHASVASSAPVLAKLDMPEYNDRVANAYSVSNNGVGGSPECREAIRKGHEVIGEMLQTEQGQRSLERTFGFASGDLSSLSRQKEFAGQGVARFPAQSNDITCSRPACNIGKICAIMLNSSAGDDEVSRLATLRKMQHGDGAVRANDQDNGSVRWTHFWGWQTCTEFGFYQTCEKNSSCFFTQGLDSLDDNTRDCVEKWGISLSEIKVSIEATNAHYGGLRPTGPQGQEGRCVMWPNGEVDPWAGLSVLEAPNEAMPVLYVSGASHHSWTHASAATDQTSVVSARSVIRKQVEAFLEQDCSMVSIVAV